MVTVVGCGAGGMVIVGGGTLVMVTGGGAVVGAVTKKLATADQSLCTGRAALTLQKYCVPAWRVIVAGVTEPAAAGVSVNTVVAKVGEVESWNSYWVVPATGVQEKAGLTLVMVEPLVGEEIVGTAAARGWMVNDRTSEYGLFRCSEPLRAPALSLQ